MDHANNNFSGSIPHNIDNLSIMRSTSQYYEFYYYKFDVFTKGQDLYCSKCNINLVKSLDLTIEISKGIRGKIELNNLNLSRNHLEGKIPWWIGGMK